MTMILGNPDFMHCVLDPENLNITFNGDCRGWYGTRILPKVIVRFRFINERLLELLESSLVSEEVFLQAYRMRTKIPPSQELTIGDALHTEGTLSFKTDMPATLQDIIALCQEELGKICSDPLTDDKYTQVWIYKQ